MIQTSVCEDEDKDEDDASHDRSILNGNLVYTPSDLARPSRTAM